MNIGALAEQYLLQPQVLEIYGAVTALSGKEVDFREVSDLDVAARIKVARQRMGQHILFYDREHCDRLNHLLAHELGHILRILAVPPAERLVSATEDQHIRIAAQTLSREMGFLPATLRPKVLTMWVSGLVLQMVNQPIDVRVEQWLAAEYPDFAQEQARGIRAEASTSLGVLSPDVEQLSAPTVFRLTNAMNYAYLRAVGPIVNENYVAHYTGRDEIVALGEQLYHWLTDETLSDLAVVNHWAGTLGIAEWFYWRDFEDMPESYYQDEVLPRD